MHILAHSTILAACTAVMLLLGHPLLAAETRPQTPIDQRDRLEKWLAQEKIESEEAAISFYLKMVNAGCKPEEAYRWTRMALFADREWNLAELAGIVEEQIQAGATRQVVEKEMEKQILARAAEQHVDMSKFPTALASPPKGVETSKKPSKVPGKKP